MADRNALPSGTVTFLFTDLEGSTRLWEEYPDAMHDALARHDEILRDAIEKHDGHVVKHTGDGLHAAFATARDALDAALATQLALTAEPWASTGPSACTHGCPHRRGPAPSGRLLRHRRSIVRHASRTLPTVSRSSCRRPPRSW